MATEDLRDRLAVDYAFLVLRFAVGIIFIGHGAQKMFGVFGGHGLAAFVHNAPIGYLVAIGEFFDGIGLLVGFLSRFSAASLIVIMFGAIYLVTGRNGFFLGEQPEFEYNFVLIGMLMPILIARPGRFTLSPGCQCRLHPKQGERWSFSNE